MTTADERPRVRYTKQGPVATIIMDRPHVLNAMDVRMHHELAAAWDDVERDEEVLVAVLTGTGGRAFSVGQDLKETARLGRAGNRAPSSFGSRGRPGWPRLTERFELSKPVVAQVDGFALGGGFELALACDIIVASDRSVFGLPEARLGLIAGAGGVFRLTRQAPYRAAIGYLMTGRRMSAARAYELGLVNEVVAAGELASCVSGWVSDILRCAPLSVRAIKQVAAASATLPLAEAFAADYEWERRRMYSTDAVEGPRAFAEGRPPRWLGR
ncbi:enoyl-CoA-hydratase DpgD [Dactylosporangium sp. CA-233914]|uniref:enoyl-CoA-hydratase DpgD n=1 Tax=Dactylosporangium sp. CA-233914 TaxID=3239934 RepID=UPI003D8BE716